MPPKCRKGWKKKLKAKKAARLAGDLPEEKKAEEPQEQGIAQGQGLEAARAAAEAVAKKAMTGQEAYVRLMDEAMDKINCTTTTNPEKLHPHARDITVTGLNMSLGANVMIEDAQLNLNYGRRYGLIGPNGCGKSLLLTLIGRRMIPMPASIDTYHVVAEIDANDMTALEAVLAVDVEKQKLEAEADALADAIAEGDESDETQQRMTEVYERLDELEADTAEARAALILHGLGFTKEMQAKATKDFSGGWRMRISLARALFLNPTLLVLDEPTNHLDMEAVVWLERYLARFHKILIMISHSQDFLNSVCTNILHFHKQKLTNYPGDYDTYVRARREREEHQMKRYRWEQDQIKQMKTYIARFGHGTSKMARQAQSKEKTLAKMVREGLTEKVESDSIVTLRFNDPGTIPPPVLQVQRVCFAYPNCPLLYKDVDFGVDLDSRIALVGPNGAGKTTFLKLMSGALTPTSGMVRPHAHLRIATYTQHFVDALDMDMTPLDYFISIYKDDDPRTLRSDLGRFGVSGTQQGTQIKYLSDGIKSRVVFSKIAKDNPHVLFLDEPTNHLDIESIDALADAINRFSGGMVLVSHDMRLISQVAKEIWECDKGTLTRYNGSITEYKVELARKLDAAAMAFEDGSGGGMAGGGDGVAQAAAAAAGAGGSAPLRLVQPVKPEAQVGGGDKPAAAAPAAAKPTGGGFAVGGGGFVVDDGAAAPAPAEGGRWR